LVPAVAPILAVAGVLAVTSIPADPGVPIFVVVFTKWKKLKTLKMATSGSPLFRMPLAPVL